MPLMLLRCCIRSRLSIFVWYRVEGLGAAIPPGHRARYDGRMIGFGGGSQGWQPGFRVEGLGTALRYACQAALRRAGAGGSTPSRRREQEQRPVLRQRQRAALARSGRLRATFAGVVARIGRASSPLSCPAEAEAAGIRVPSSSQSWGGGQPAGVDPREEGVDPKVLFGRLRPKDTFQRAKTRLSTPNAAYWAACGAARGGLRWVRGNDTVAAYLWIWCSAGVRQVVHGRLMLGGPRRLAMRPKLHRMLLRRHALQRRPRLLSLITRRPLL